MQADEIDKLILANASPLFLKVAMVIGRVLNASDVNAEIIAGRINVLVAAGKWKLTAISSTGVIAKCAYLYRRRNEPSQLRDRSPG
jgi:Protein of unknown function